MLGIPTNFQSISPVLSSYDWLDVTSGCGYRRYYATVSNVTGAQVNYLTTRLVGAPTSFNNLAVVDPTQNCTIDFDITMQTPCVISGRAIVNLTYINTGSAGNMDSKVTISHVLAGVGTVTQFGQTQGATRTTGATACRDSLLVDLTTKHFGIGDKLRLEIFVEHTTGANKSFTVYFDPTSNKTFTDADSRTIGTDLTFDCPFKVNL